MNPLRKTWRRYDEKAGSPRMTTREALHQLVDQLPENQALASLDRGLADLAVARVKPLAEYERERGL
jgi:hypothetical protein